MLTASRTDWTSMHALYATKKCDPMLETIPNGNSGKIKLVSPAYSETTILLASNLNFSLFTWSWFCIAGVNSQWYERLEWQLLTLARVCAGRLLHFSHYRASTALSGWFLGFTCALPPFCIIIFTRSGLWGWIGLRWLYQHNLEHNRWLGLQK